MALPPPAVAAALPRLLATAGGVAAAPLLLLALAATTASRGVTGSAAGPDANGGRIARASATDIDFPKATRGIERSFQKIGSSSTQLS